MPRLLGASAENNSSGSRVREEITHSNPVSVHQSRGQQGKRCDEIPAIDHRQDHINGSPQLIGGVWSEREYSFLMLPRLLAPAIKNVARACGRPGTLFKSGLPGRSCLLGAVLLVLSASAASAQTFSLITGSDSATSLSGLWRFHTGDNPAWADPNFDDSQWPLIHSGESWTEQGYPAFTGYAWCRFKLEVPSHSGPVDLLLTGFVNGYQVYANGKLIGSAGSAVPTRDPVAESPATTFRLPESGND